MALGHSKLGLFLSWQLKMRFLCAVYQPSAPPTPPLSFLPALPSVTQWCGSVIDGWYPKPGPVPTIRCECWADGDCCTKSGPNLKMLSKSKFSFYEIITEKRRKIMFCCCMFGSFLLLWFPALAHHHPDGYWQPGVLVQPFFPHSSIGLSIFPLQIIPSASMKGRNAVSWNAEDLSAARGFPDPSLNADRVPGALCKSKCPCSWIVRGEWISDVQNQVVEEERSQRWVGRRWGVRNVCRQQKGVMGQ